MKKKILVLKNRMYTIAAYGAMFVAATLLTASGVHAQNISTAAGNNALGAGYSGDGGAATAAKLYNPNGLAKDAAGNLYIADYSNNVIRKVNTSGTISTYAGNNTAGYSGDGAAATTAQLNGPWGLAMDPSGNLYVSDYNNYVIRKITPTGTISTFAGSNVPGSAGDGGAATAAQIYRAVGICLDDTGNLYIADSWNHKIRKVSTTGIMSTIAGTGTAGYSGDGSAATAAKLNYPYGVAITSSGKLYIADYSNYVVREVNTPTGNIATVAGNNTYGYSGDGSVPTLAQLSHPVAVAIDPTQTKLYISDMDNNRVRMATNPPNITTYAGTGSGGYTGDGGAANAAKIFQPSGMFCDVNGDLYLCDKANQVIRKVTPLPVAVTGGPLNFCVGSSVSLSASISGGQWVSGNTAVATVAGTGVVTGIIPGTARIYYTDANSLGMAIVTVSAVPSAITGTTTLCQGATTTLSSTTTGGGWISSNTAVATTASGGVITGAGAGTATITYSIGGVGCYVTTIVSVNPLPDAGTISGTNNVCEANTVTLTNTATGGTWSSSNTATATVSSSGVVTGVAAGTATISYTASNSCGTTNATLPFTVNSCPTYVKGIPTKTTTLTAYPNPAATGKFTLQLASDNNETVRIEIVNVAGVKVKEFITTSNIPVEIKLNEPTGIYFLSATTAQGRYMSKVMVN